MPPKRKTDASATAPKGKSTKVYGKAPELPEGETLTDFKKNEWRLVRAIGSGGFGRIYLALKVGDKDAHYVVKMEPSTNGPLFQEIHFYQRVGKEEQLKQWKKQKGLKFLGIPPFIAAGLHVKNAVEFRYLVMPRLGADLESHRITCESGRLPPSFVFRLSTCCLDALEYLHYAAQYVHADVKAENLLAASPRSLTTGEEFYLVDYGLARKVSDKPVYKEAPKKAHDGTLIFTSLDAHRGCAPSYRGDVEILAYNIIYWITGSLPWINVQNDPEKVFQAKQNLSTTFRTELPRLPLLSPFSKELVEFFNCAYSLDYADRPDFDKLRQVLQQASTKSESISSSSSTSSSGNSTKEVKKRDSSNATPKKANGTLTLRKALPSPKTTNGASISKKTLPLLRNFINNSDDLSKSSVTENGDEEPQDCSSQQRLPRSTTKVKTILADDTPSPSTSRVLSPRSIIPGKANLRRYSPNASARRRSSILVKKKYLGPKKATNATAKVTVGISTRSSSRGGSSKPYRISSSSDDSE